MRLTYRRPLALGAAAALALCAPAVAAAHGSGHGHGDHHGKGLRAIKRIVVIYEENHSFDNLYGGWEGVNGLRAADAAHTTQVDQDGTPYTCLLQDDVNLTSPPLPATCTTRRRHDVHSHFTNNPFSIDDYIPPMDTTCPPPGDFPPNGASTARGARGLHARPRAPLLPGAVPAQRRQAESLRDGQRRRRPHHGHYDTRALPIYRYLHGRGHPDYAIADDFFQAAFGGSFLNHQWLIAAATPTFADAAARRPALGRRRQRDADATTRSTPRRPARARERDRALHRPDAAARPPPDGRAATTRSTPSSRPTSRSPGTGAAAAAADRRRRSAIG